MGIDDVEIDDTKMDGYREAAIELIVNTTRPAPRRKRERHNCGDRPRFEND